MKKIFFSYSRKDEKFALKLATDLQKSGADIWLDQLHIRPSEPWDEEIEKGLAESQCVLVILSPVSVASENVLNEINFALEEKKQVLPVIISGDVRKPFNIRRIQHIDMTGDYEAGLAKLLLVLNMQVPQEKAPGAIASIDGKWTSGELVNPFDEHDKFMFVFEFETMGSMLLGTVAKISCDKRYKTEKAFADGKIKAGVISFFTNEQSTLGSEIVNYKDLFYGSITNESIKFMMQSDHPWGFPLQRFLVKRV